MLIFETNPIEKLRNLSPDKLSGKKSHLKFAPSGRIRADYTPEPSGARKSAVMILICPDNSGGYTFPLIQRSKDKSAHSEQISLPGGKYELYDKDLFDTALRETYEEIGVETADVNLITQLSTLYIPVSNFSVFPFVGYCPETPEFRPSGNEVAKLFHIPLAELLNFRKETKSVNTIYGTIDAPFMCFEHLELWGATAMILQEFSDILRTSI